MYKLLFLCFWIFLCEIAHSQSKEEITLSQAVESLKQALLSGDKAALESITAAELSYGHSSGVVEDKAAFVEALSSGKSDFITLDLSDQSLKVAGNTAWVRHKLTADILTNGQSATVKLMVLLVWIKQKGQWKLLARQAAKI